MEAQPRRLPKQRLEHFAKLRYTAPHLVGRRRGPKAALQFAASRLPLTQTNVIKGEQTKPRLPAGSGKAHHCSAAEPGDSGEGDECPRWGQRGSGSVATGERLLKAETSCGINQVGRHVYFMNHVFMCSFVHLFVMFAR